MTNETSSLYRIIAVNSKNVPYLNKKKKEEEHNNVLPTPRRVHVEGVRRRL